MRRMLPALFSLLLGCYDLSAQKAGNTADTLEFSAGSRVTVLPNLSIQQIENLSLLGKIWGFLKYYHPVVAEGHYNWDYELFRILPTYLEAPDSTHRDSILLAWIKHLGPIAPCKNCSEDIKNEYIKPDLDWINTDRLADSLKMLLNFIRLNRHQGKKYYVELVPRVANPNILHENAYAQFVYPDAGYRLLALYRYWNIIQYWFPDKHLIQEDWKKVLPEFIPRFINAKNERDYCNTTQQLIACIHDSHANLLSSSPEWNNRFGKYYPPFIITFVGDDPVVSIIVNDTLTGLSNIQRGDVIKEVNGKTIANIIAECLPDLPASNYTTQLRDLSRQLLLSKDSISNVTVEREGKRIECKLHHFILSKWSDWYRYDYPYQENSSFFFISPGIGYINLGGIKKKQVDSVFKAIENSKGLIIDNRQYPGDFALYDIAAKLNPEARPFAKFPIGNIDYPGSFTVTKPITAGKRNRDYYKGKVIVLVNENTQSSGEFHSMAFRTAPDVTVIGSTTAGADGNVTNFFFLPGGLFTRFTGIGVLYPNGQETQRVGIIPDVEVKRTVRGIKEGRDELVEKAIDLINNGTGLNVPSSN
ncbi:MAG: S41 family peptidase [Flavisolibacter sp.]